MRNQCVLAVFVLVSTICPGVLLPLSDYFYQSVAIRLSAAISPSSLPHSMTAFDQVSSRAPSCEEFSKHGRDAASNFCYPVYTLCLCHHSNSLRRALVSSLPTVSGEQAYTLCVCIITVNSLKRASARHCSLNYRRP